jgi:hypothetical protein
MQRISPDCSWQRVNLKPHQNIFLHFIPSKTSIPFFVTPTKLQVELWLYLSVPLQGYLLKSLDHPHKKKDATIQDANGVKS